MKRLEMFSLIACLVFILSACNDTNETKTAETQPAKVAATQATPAPVAQVEAPECQLNMGWDPWEPYQYLTPDDQVKGLEIELVTAMANEAGCKLTFVQKNWMNLLNGIRNGSIDILGGASKTEARESFAHFSDQYRHESFVLYVRKGEAVNYAGKSLEEIIAMDFKLGVTDDYIYGDSVSDLQDDEALSKKFISVSTTEVNYYNLVQNQIDGFLEDPFVAAYTIKRKGLQDQIEALPIQIHSGDVALMFSKKSVEPETVEAFNLALAQLKESGQYKKILDKYSF